MHTKNPFAKDYNFDLLVSNYPLLKSYVFTNDYGNKTIKFGNQDAVMALNSALLKTQYGIDWEIPQGYLCPPIPGRLDYLLHINDLVYKEDAQLLDIGTGANLIYPILAKMHFNWNCAASEVDESSLKSAKNIIQQNQELSGIELRQQTDRRSILKNVISENDSFDVLVCNPPFFKSSLEAKKQNSRKVKNLNLKEKSDKNFGGTSNELWCKGGEEAFVKTLAAESIEFKNQVAWFTSLVSNKDHLKNIKRSINKTAPKEVKVIEMAQGNKVSRFVAWRFK